MGRSHDGVSLREGDESLWLNLEASALRAVVRQYRAALTALDSPGEECFQESHVVGWMSAAPNRQHVSSLHLLFEA